MVLGPISYFDVNSGMDKSPSRIVLPQRTNEKEQDISHSPQIEVIDVEELGPAEICASLNCALLNYEENDLVALEEILKKASPEDTDAEVQCIVPVKKDTSVKQISSSNENSDVMQVDTNLPFIAFEEQSMIDSEAEQELPFTEQLDPPAPYFVDSMPLEQDDESWSYGGFVGYSVLYDPRGIEVPFKPRVDLSTVGEKDKNVVQKAFERLLCGGFSQEALRLVQALDAQKFENIDQSPYCWWDEKAETEFFMLAVLYKSQEVIRFLKDRIDVHHSTEEGGVSERFSGAATAMEAALQAQNKEMVLDLAQKGASLLSEDALGRSVWKQVQQLFGDQGLLEVVNSISADRDAQELVVVLFKNKMDRAARTLYLRIPGESWDVSICTKLFFVAGQRGIKDLAAAVMPRILVNSIIERQSAVFPIHFALVHGWEDIVTACIKRGSTVFGYFPSDKIAPFIQKTALKEQVEKFSQSKKMSELIQEKFGAQYLQNVFDIVPILSGSTESFFCINVKSVLSHLIRTENQKSAVTFYKRICAASPEWFADQGYKSEIFCKAVSHKMEELAELVAPDINPLYIGEGMTNFPIAYVALHYTTTEGDAKQKWKTVLLDLLVDGSTYTIKNAYKETYFDVVAQSIGVKEMKNLLNEIPATETTYPHIVANLLSLGKKSLAKTLFQKLRSSSSSSWRNNVNDVKTCVFCHAALAGEETIAGQLLQDVTVQYTMPVTQRTPLACTIYGKLDSIAVELVQKKASLLAKDGKQLVFDTMLQELGVDPSLALIQAVRNDADDIADFILLLLKKKLHMYAIPLLQQAGSLFREAKIWKNKQKRVAIFLEIADKIKNVKASLGEELTEVNSKKELIVSLVNICKGLMFDFVVQDLFQEDHEGNFLLFTMLKCGIRHLVEDSVARYFLNAGISQQELDIAATIPDGELDLFNQYINDEKKPLVPRLFCAYVSGNQEFIRTKLRGLSVSDRLTVASKFKSFFGDRGEVMIINHAFRSVLKRPEALSKTIAESSSALVPTGCRGVYAEPNIFALSGLTEFCMKYVSSAPSFSVKEYLALETFQKNVRAAFSEDNLLSQSAGGYELGLSKKDKQYRFINHMLGAILTTLKEKIEGCELQGQISGAEGSTRESILELEAGGDLAAINILYTVRTVIYRVLKMINFVHVADTFDMHFESIMQLYIQVCVLSEYGVPGQISTLFAHSCNRVVQLMREETPAIKVPNSFCLRAEESSAFISEYFGYGDLRGDQTVSNDFLKRFADKFTPYSKYRGIIGMVNLPQDLDAFVRTYSQFFFDSWKASKWAIIDQIAPQLEQVWKGKVAKKKEKVEELFLQGTGVSIPVNVDFRNEKELIQYLKRSINEERYIKLLKETFMKNHEMRMTLIINLLIKCGQLE